MTAGTACRSTNATVVRWSSGSYDASLNLVYWGTGGPIPHSEIVRGTGDGAVLYTDSTLALDPDTGKIVWYHQFLPRDNWNFDHVFEQVLADIEVDGHLRQSLLTIGKPGIIWALERLAVPVPLRNRFYCGVPLQFHNFLAERCNGSEVQSSTCSILNRGVQNQGGRRSVGRGLMDQYDAPQSLSERLAELVRQIEQATNE
jgi:hypothetical protein